MPTIQSSRAVALLASGLAVFGGVALAAPVAAQAATVASTTVTGTLRPGSSVTVGTRGTVKICLTNRGPAAAATVVLRATTTERVTVRTRVCTSVSTFNRLIITNASSGSRPSVVGYTVYGAVTSTS